MSTARKVWIIKSKSSDFIVDAIFFSKERAQECLVFGAPESKDLEVKKAKLEIED